MENLSARPAPGQALAALEAHLRQQPNDVEALTDIAILLEASGETQSSLSRYDQALRLAPDHFRALLNRAVLAAALGRLDEALQDNLQLTKRYVGSWAAFYNLADVLLRLDRYAEAQAAIERALRLRPDAANILMLRGLVLAMLGRDAEARASFEHARRVDAAAAENFHAAAARAAGVAVPQRLTLDQIRLARLLERQKDCDWSGREWLIAGMRALAAELRQTTAPLEETGLYHTALSLPLTASEQQALAQGLALGLKNSVCYDAPASRTSSSTESRKIRLGFLSPNFREHPSAQLNWRHFLLRNRSRFEVFAYSLHLGEGPLRERIVSSCDAFREVGHLVDVEIAELIAADGIDILVDLSGHMDYARPGVLVRKPAPLRAAFLGLPGTMGMELIDYRIGDKAAIASEQIPFWGERLVLLPETAFIYNNEEPVSPIRPERETCGLQRGSFVFCCFNAPYKIEPDVFSVWMRLLVRLPQAMLWLIDGGEAVKRNLRREAVARGVKPERIIFASRLPRKDHLARHVCADLFLDTFYCGAMATAADALWAGLPVLTCHGGTMASSQSSSIVRAAGIAELVAPDYAAYESMALRLATEPQELAALREKLARNRMTCALFDTAQRVRELDCAFEMMWQRHLAGLPPESFAVPREAGVAA